MNENVRLFILLIMMLVLPLSLAATGGGEKSSVDMIPKIVAANLDGRKLKVVASTSFIGDVLSEIAGSETEILVLMPRGQNHHSWEPDPANIVAVENADLTFVNGFGLEESFLDIVANIKTACIIPVSVGVEPIENHGNESRHEAINPHVWFSPLNVIIWAQNIESALSRANPAHAEAYQSAAASYISRLKKLDTEIQKAVSGLEHNERKLVTDHSSFDYFLRSYGLITSGKIISSSNDQADPSGRDIVALTEQIQKENIRIILVGETASEGLKRLAQAVAAASERDLLVVKLLTDSLAPPGERGDTCVDFIRYNSELIIRALGKK